MKDKELRDRQYEEQSEEPIVQDRPFTFYIKGNMATEAYQRAKNYVYSPYNDYGIREADNRAPQQPVADGKHAKDKKKKSKKGRVIGYKLRRPAVLLAAILVIAVLVVNVLSVVGMMPDYTGMFITKNTSDDAGSTYTGEDGNEYTVPTHKGRSFADPIMSLITYFGGDKNAAWSEDDMISQSFFTTCFTKVMEEGTSDPVDGGSGSSSAENESPKTAYAEEGSGSESTSSGSESAAPAVDQNTVRKICYIAMPIVIILFLIMSVYLAIKLLYSLFTGKTVKYGFCFFVNILYLVIIAVLTMVWNEIGIGEAVNVFASALKAFGMLEDVNYASNAALGLGFYISILCTLLGWIIAGFSVKKIREQLDEHGRPVSQYRR